MNVEHGFIKFPSFCSRLFSLFSFTVASNLSPPQEPITRYFSLSEAHPSYNFSNVTVVSRAVASPTRAAQLNAHTYMRMLGTADERPHGFINLTPTLSAPLFFIIRVSLFFSFLFWYLMNDVKILRLNDCNKKRVKAIHMLCIFYGSLGFDSFTSIFSISVVSLIEFCYLNVASA